MVPRNLFYKKKKYNKMKKKFEKINEFYTNNGIIQSFINPCQVPMNKK